MTIFNKKAFALSALVISSVFAQTAQAVSFAFITDGAGHVKTFVVTKATSGKQYIADRSNKKAGFIVAGVALSAAVIAYAVNYYKTQQPKRAIVNAELNPTIQLAELD